jgi:multisubunit Na+/H+ antiporter MnhB subunit
MSNHFWYGFAGGVAIALVIVIVTLLFDKACKRSKG